MASRLALHEVFKKILGDTLKDHVYYQPPESSKMQYPAIRYVRDDIDNTFADDIVYMQSHVYKVTVMDEEPDSEIVEKVSKLPTCTFSRHYEANDLNHDVFILHY